MATVEDLDNMVLVDGEFISENDVYDAQDFGKVNKTIDDIEFYFVPDLDDINSFVLM